MLGAEDLEGGHGSFQGIFAAGDGQDLAQEGRQVLSRLGEAQVAVRFEQGHLGRACFVAHRRAEMVVPEPDSHHENQQYQQRLRETPTKDLAIGVAGRCWQVGVDVMIDGQIAEKSQA